MPNEILSMSNHRRNSALIVDAVTLGYISGDVLDLTYGLGTFWAQRQPVSLVANDLNPEKGDVHHDYRLGPLPEWVRAFDTCVFDPDYRLNGTPDLGDFDERYGIDIPKRWQDRLHDICDGAHTGSMTLKMGGHLLVKCQTQVVSGHKVWMETLITDTVAHRCVLIDRLHIRTNPRPQRSQKHSRSNYSTLLIFRRKDRF